MNAYACLGLEPRLAVSEGTLREAFRRAGSEMHPDAGGSEADFAKLREAFAIVSSPSRRLKHWLEMRGIAVESRGTISEGLMELFSRVGAVMQAADTLARKRQEAQSALTRALLERETQVCREEVEAAVAVVEEAMAGVECRFPVWETTDPDADEASAAVRNLAFLEKWRGGLRGAYSRLV